jgi:3-oxoacyl-[acyl-carrier-protein] synthase-1
MADALGIDALAAISPVGNGLLQTCASARAGISRFAPHPTLECASGDPESEEPVEPLVIGLSKRFPDGIEAPERLIAMLLTCLNDMLLAEAMAASDLVTSAFLLALPPDDAAVSEWELRECFAASLWERAGLPAPAIFETNQSGHTGMFELCGRAFELLQEGAVESCFVAGSDTYNAAARVALLDGSKSLHSSRGHDGFIPGEAVSILRLSLPQTGSAVALLERPAFGREPQPATSDRHSTGEGLAQSIRAITEGRRWDRVYCDLNGQSYRFAEWGLMRVRLTAELGDDLVLVHPAECLGDVGAATGGVLVGCAVQALKRGYAGVPQALLWTASDDGARASLCVRDVLEKE